MTLKEVLLLYKAQTGVSNEYIAKQVGVNRSTVSRWLSEDTKVMKQEVIEKLSYLLSMDVQALLDDKARYQKPVIGVAKAGYNHFAQEEFEYLEDVSKDDFYRGDYFLRVTGSSMDGAHIHDQDLIYVKACHDVTSGSIAVVLIAHEEATIKRVIKKDDFLILEAANPDVETRYFTKQEVLDLPVQIIGKVLYSRSDFR